MEASVALSRLLAAPGPPSMAHLFSSIPSSGGLIHHNPVSVCSLPKGKPFGRMCYAYSLLEVFDHSII